MSVKVRLASMATAQIITINIFVTVRQDTQEITAKQVCTIYMVEPQRKTIRLFFLEIFLN